MDPLKCKFHFHSERILNMCRCGAFQNGLEKQLRESHKCIIHNILTELVSGSPIVSDFIFCLTHSLSFFFFFKHREVQNNFMEVVAHSQPIRTSLMINIPWSKLLDQWDFTVGVATKCDETKTETKWPKNPKNLLADTQTILIVLMIILYYFYRKK